MCVIWSPCDLTSSETLSLIDWAFAWWFVRLQLWSRLLIMISYLGNWAWIKSIRIWCSVTLCVCTTCHPIILNHFPRGSSKLLLSKFELVFGLLNLVFKNSMVDVFKVSILFLPINLVVMKYNLFVINYGLTLCTLPWRPDCILQNGPWHCIDDSIGEDKRIVFIADVCGW